MGKYRECCEEVVGKVNGCSGDGGNSVEAIKEYVMMQILLRNLDKNKYIPMLVSYLDSSMGIWDRGHVHFFDLISELSKLVDGTPTQQPQQPNPEDVLRQRLSHYIDEKNLKLLLSQLPTIKSGDLKKFWYKKYIRDSITMKAFFELCADVVPWRKGERGWNTKNFQDS